MKKKTPKAKLEFAVEFMKAIVGHCVDGGSYRHLIYDRMGLGMDSYVPMYDAGGMEFSNACPVNMDPEIHPHFAWAGVATVSEFDPDNPERCIVQWTEKPEFSRAHSRQVDVWHGHQFVTGETVLVVYFSGAHGGTPVALKAGEYYAAWRLDQDRTPPE